MPDTASFHHNFFQRATWDLIWTNFFPFFGRTTGIWYKLEQPANLPGIFSPKIDSPAIKQQDKNDLIHPSFLPPCEHGDDGDMHAHAFGKHHPSLFRSGGSFPSDLLSLSNGTPVQVSRPLPVHSQTAPQTVPSSVPSHPSYLTATRPQVTQEKAGKENAPRARRMSSSTTGVLGRGKLGLTGTGENGSGLNGVGKDRYARPLSFRSDYAKPHA